MNLDRKQLHKTVEFEIDLLPSGYVKFCRSDQKTNSLILCFLDDILTQKQFKEIKEFLDGSLQIELLVGDEQLCG